MGQKHWKIQLMDGLTGEALMTAGGRALIVTAGANNRQAITDSGGAAATNPVTPTRGMIEFYTADTVVSVDIYAMAATGHFVVAKTVKPSGPNEIVIDTQNRHQVMIIPFDMADMTAAVEFDVGFLEPANSLFLPNPMVLVETADVGEDLDVGNNTDPNGFLAALDVGTIGNIKGTLADGAATIGVLLKVDESAGDFVPEGYVGLLDTISITPTAGSDTMDGKIALPYMLTNW